MRLESTSLSKDILLNINEYMQDYYVIITVVVLKLDIALRNWVIITMVKVILELALMLGLLIIMTMVIVKSSNHFKFKASYTRDILLHI